MDGYRKASFGKEGSGPLQFNGPDGIAISPITGQVYIADSGSANGQFQYPHEIAIDSQGLVYVTDFGNHRIQKFSPDGKFFNWFSTEGSGPGQLNSPYDITIDTAERKLSTSDVPPVLRIDDQLLSEDKVKEIKTGLSAMKTGVILDIFSYYR
ncbi:PREDICTED: RING finger protein nhl-1-like [Amphimedon queenslandica]|uniref:Peptidylamidoglycolate lyase n=1 Tax=Amphimedon queenslandica TaxID=400682 RepID=A0AAN0IR35_AMPQE|nr:PREDICTED: RING finger protein nhl-1-like [Amphimedon queenslandica]|eukprot:XP_011407572.1 PREDICTED: RING finger protein nhl-1-like [Amphimedon queenslandica]